MPVIQVVPITGWNQKKSRIKTNIEIIPNKRNGLTKKSIVDCLQTRPIDHRHRLVKIRTAALRALAKLNLNEHIETFIACLEDESPKVSREAAQSLLQSRNFVTYQEQIWLLINKDLASHVKLNAFSLISKLSKWDSIFYLLKLSRLDDEMILERTQVAMGAWWSSYNRTFTQPNDYQKKRIREELDNNPSIGRTRKSLEDIFQSFD